MRNVVVFGADGERYAVELRWVREIVTLGPVTHVPAAPRHVIGAACVRGAITAVLDPAAICGAARQRARTVTHAGDVALLLDVDGVNTALRMDAVDEVSTVEDEDARAAGRMIAGTVVDSHGRTVPLIDPPELLRVTLALARSGPGRGASPAMDRPVPGQADSGQS